MCKVPTALSNPLQLNVRLTCFLGDNLEEESDDIATVADTRLLLFLTTLWRFLIGTDDSSVMLGRKGSHEVDRFKASLWIALFIEDFSLFCGELLTERLHFCVDVVIQLVLDTSVNKLFEHGESGLICDTVVDELVGNVDDVEQELSSAGFVKVIDIVDDPVLVAGVEDASRALVIAELLADAGLEVCGAASRRLVSIKAPEADVLEALVSATLLSIGSFVKSLLSL